MHQADSPTHWRECAFVSIKKAAEILGYSPVMVRQRIAEGRLFAYRRIEGGPMVVAVGSLAAHVDNAIPVQPSELRGAKLRLVVNNTA